MNSAQCLAAAMSLVAISWGQPPQLPREDAPSRSFMAFRGAAAIQFLSTSATTVSLPLDSYEVTVLREFPHVDAPWTQGLEYSADGKLVETSGDYPPGSGSFVRILDPETGKPERTLSNGLVHENGTAMFVEGIVQLSGHWYATTYQDQVAVEYNHDFQVMGYHPFPWEGWGLTHSADHSSFLVTNSTQYVMYLDKGTWEVQNVKVATCLGKPVAGLNELEMVDDFFGKGPALLGNLINTRVVLVLDPSTLVCTGVFHLEGLEPKQINEAFGYHVANGIAYNKKAGTFYFTGKNWRSMYEVKLSEKSENSENRLDDRARSLLNRLLLRT